MKQVGIIILNYKTYDLTLKLIKNIRENINYKNYNIIVIDNNSQNESDYFLNKNKDNLNYIYISNTENKGYASGNNIGLKKSVEINNDISIIMNNDVILNDSEILEKIVQILYEKEDTACVSPRIVNIFGKETKQDVVEPNLLSFTFFAPVYYILNLILTKIVKKDIHIYRPQGCCMAIKNNDLIKIGYLDESTFLYCEEGILAERLKQINRKCRLCDKAKVIHNHSTTINTTYDRQKKFQIYKNSLEIYLKEYLKYGNIKTNIVIAFMKAKWRIR